MKKVDKNTVIGDILDADIGTARFFNEMGMHCVGCPASRGESLAEACQVHQVDCDQLMEKLNHHLAAAQ